VSDLSPSTPKGIFSVPPSATAVSNRQDNAAAKRIKADAGKSRDGTNDVEGKDQEEAGGSLSYSIFVKNLAFATTDESLRKHFDRSVSSWGGFIRSAKVSH
jgi:multiple RNA-binding domain-containing protein 1